jgi:uncharacterized membrane protein
VRDPLVLALAPPARSALLGLLVFSAAVWVGGLVAIAVVARVARRTLAPAERVAFFRGLGRSYGGVGGTALGVALVTGALLAVQRPWDGLRSASAAVAGCLVATTAVGVVQARAMTRLRAAALGGPTDPELATRVRRGARRAAALRGGIAVLSLTLVALGALLAA